MARDPGSRQGGQSTKPHLRRVLVFPAGTEIGLEIFQALKGCKEIALFGAGQDISSHARYLDVEYHPLPSVQGVSFPLRCIHEHEHERVPVRIHNNPGTVEMDRAPARAT